MKRGIMSLAVWATMAAPAAALPSNPPLVALAIGPKDYSEALVTAFEDQLRQSRRFLVASPIEPVALDQPLASTLKKLRKLTKADWVFVGNYASTKEKGVELSGRIYNLTLGDRSKDLHFQATSEDVPGLARQLTLFMRSQNPLKGEITGLRDSRVLLDVGSEDGVANGSCYTITRPTGLDRSVIGLVKVVSTDPWFSTAEIVSRVKGMPFIPGDEARENVGYSLIH